MVNMYKVAILEDEKVYARIFEDYLKELLEIEEMDYQIDIYEGTKELEKNISNNYHLFVLDHLLEDMNRVNFARKLKSTGNNADIIFVGGNEELKKSEEIPEANILVKPVDEIEVKEVFRKCIIEYFSRDSITVIENDVELEVRPEDIYFVEHIYNGIKVQGENYCICTLDSVEDLFPLIEGRQFFRCHKDYIVNLKYVQEIEKYDFKLMNGQVVPIVKNMYKTAQKELLEYIK